jgi:uncharacterized membrane protein YdfJ with MMPL/SSD domain
MNPRFFKLGTWVASHPRLVLVIWALCIALGAVGSHRLSQVAVGGAGGIEDSPSAVASELLRTEFQNPYRPPPRSVRCRRCVE